MSLNIVDEDLIRKAQQGDQEALDTIVKEYKNIISLNVKNYYIVGGDQEDLLQEGTIGLLKALKSYKKGKSSFKTFAIICIRSQIITAIKAANTQKNTALNIAITNKNFISDENKENDDVKYGKTSLSHSPEEIFLTKEKITEFRKYIENNFSAFEKQVFEYMIRGYSYREIANILSVNTKKIDNSFQRIKKKSENWISDYNLQ